MTWKHAVDLHNLPHGQRQVVDVDGTRILVLNHNNQIYASEPNCPHMRLPLKNGQVTDECALVCPWHKSAFDLKTGDAKQWSPWPPVLGNMLAAVSRKKALKVYPTKVEGDHIWVDV